MDLTLYSIAKDTYQIVDMGFVSLFLVVGSQKTILIDSGFGVFNYENQLKPYVRGELWLLNTHVHPDHSNGNRHFLKTAMGEIEWQNHGLRWNANTPKIPESWNPSASFEIPFLKQQLPNDFSAQTYNQWIAKGLPTPDRQLIEGEVFDLGNRKIEIWHTPSHTTGSLCFWDSQTGFLFAGDTLSKGADWLLQLKCRADLEQMWAGYQKLSKLAHRVTKVYPAHGQMGIESNVLTDIDLKMKMVQKKLLTGHKIQHRYGEGIKFDFGGYGPLMSSSDLETFWLQSFVH
jgi:glyoxylase-like metal-dependent hydrolase (beta-lactamase superfamily II)